MTKTYHINYLKLVLDTAISLLCIRGCFYATIYFNNLPEVENGGYFLFSAIMLFIRLIALLFSIYTKIEFNKNLLTIQYLFFRKKIIDFSDIKDFNVFQGFRNINLFYIDNRKIEKIKLVFYNKKAREEIANRIAEIMEYFFVNYSDEQMYSFYNDKNQYNFAAIEKHNSLVLGLMIFAGIVTCMSVAAIALTVFVIKPKDGLFSVITQWWMWFNLILLMISYLLDKITIKKRLDCKNGIMTLYKNERIVFSVNVGTIYDYSITFNEFSWITTQAPKKVNAINIMGFSRKERKELRNKLELFIAFSRQYDNE